MRPLRNSWAAYQFDAAVMYVGLVIENALQERQKMGNESQPKYSISQVLDPEFRIPPKGSSIGGLGAVAAANPGIFTRWKEVKAA